VSHLITKLDIDESETAPTAGSSPFSPTCTPTRETSGASTGRPRSPVRHDQDAVNRGDGLGPASYVEVRLVASEPGWQTLGRYGKCLRLHECFRLHAATAAAGAYDVRTHLGRDARRGPPTGEVLAKGPTLMNHAVSVGPK
jgi:hypothetical protein